MGRGKNSTSNTNPSAANSARGDNTREPSVDDSTRRRLRSDDHDPRNQPPRIPQPHDGIPLPTSPLLPNPSESLPTIIPSSNPASNSNTPDGDRTILANPRDPEGRVNRALAGDGDVDGIPGIINAGQSHTSTTPPSLHHLFSHSPRLSPSNRATEVRDDPPAPPGLLNPRNGASRSNRVLTLFRSPSVEAQTLGAPYDDLRRQLNGHQRSFQTGYITFEDFMALHHSIVSQAEALYANWVKERDRAKRGKRRMSHGSSTLKDSQPRSTRTSVNSVEAELIREAVNRSYKDADAFGDLTLPRRPDRSHSRHSVQTSRAVPHPIPQIPTHFVTPPSRSRTNPEASSFPEFSSLSPTNSVAVIPWQLVRYPHYVESHNERKYDDMYNTFMSLRRFCMGIGRRHEREISMIYEGIGLVNNKETENQVNLDSVVNGESEDLLAQYDRILNILDDLHNRNTTLLQIIYASTLEQDLYQATIALLRCVTRLRSDVAILNDERHFAQCRITGQPPRDRDPRRDDAVARPFDANPATYAVNLDENGDANTRLFSPFFFPNLTRVSYLAGWLPNMDVISITDQDSVIQPLIYRLNSEGQVVSRSADTQYVAAGNPGDPGGDPSDHNSNGDRDGNQNSPVPRLPRNGSPPHTPTPLPPAQLPTHPNTPRPTPREPAAWQTPPSPLVPPNPPPSAPPIRPSPIPSQRMADASNSRNAGRNFGDGDRGFGAWYSQRADFHARARENLRNPHSEQRRGPPPLPPQSASAFAPNARTQPADGDTPRVPPQRTRFHPVPSPNPGANVSHPPRPPNRNLRPPNHPGDPDGNGGDEGDPPENASHRDRSPYIRHAGPVRPSQEPEERRADRSLRHNRYEPLPDKDFPGINALYFNDEEDIWIHWTNAMNSRRAGSERSMFGRAKSSATVDVMEALELHKEDQGGKGLLVTAGYKPEFDSTTIFTGMDVTTTSFEDFIGQVLEYMDMTNILGPGDNYDKARVQVLGSRLRQDARRWYNNHVTRKRKDWTFLRLVQGLESEFLKYSTFDMNKSSFDSFAQLPGEKAISAYQRLQLYSRGMLYEATPYEIKYRFYWGLRNDVRGSLTHDNVTPEKEDWSIRDMLKQAINIEQGFDAARTPRQVINQLAVPNNNGPNSLPIGARPTSEYQRSNPNRDDRHRSPGHHDRRHDNRNHNSNRPRNDPPRDPQGRYQSRPDDRNHLRDPSRPRDTTGPKDKSADTCHQCGEKGHWRGDPACKKVNLNHVPPVRRYHRVGIQSPIPSEPAGSHHSRAHSLTASDIAETTLHQADNPYDINPNDDMSDGFYAGVQSLKLHN